jgi:peptidyl-tRNA hydrolase
MEKLYVIVREDLDPGLLCAQAVHGARAFAASHPELEREWYDHENNIAILGARDESHLTELLAQAEERGIASAVFREPDCNDEITACSFAGTPEAIRLFRSLDPALERFRTKAA